MSRWNIVPFESFGDLPFGILRDDVHEKIKSELSTFRKSEESVNETDAYKQLGLFLYYDRDNKLEFVEAFPPCEPEFAGIKLLGNLPDTVLTSLANMGYRSRKMDKSYLLFDQLGFVLYLLDDSVEAVAIFRRGYYGS